MLKNGQTYLKNLAVFTPQDFKGNFGHFSTLYTKGSALRVKKNMLAVQYQDNFFLLSTMHKADTGNIKEQNRDKDYVQKPKVIQDYDEKMGSVDKNETKIGN